MGRGTVRAGAPTTGTQAADGTDNSLTLPRIIIFDPPVRPCIVTNHCTNNFVLMKINAEIDGTVSQPMDGTGTDGSKGHIALPPYGATARERKHEDVSLGGQIAVHSISFCTINASDDLDDVSVVGWNP